MADELKTWFPEGCKCRRKGPRCATCADYKRDDTKIKTLVAKNRMLFEEVLKLRKQLEQKSERELPSSTYGTDIGCWRCGKTGRKTQQEIDDDDYLDI